MKMPDVDIRDVLVFGGLLLASVGAGLVFLPAALIVLGAGMVLIPFAIRLWG